MFKYSWSFRENEDLFSNCENSIEECIKCAIEEQKGAKVQAQVIYIGENVPHVPIADADAFIEGLQEEAWNQCGECAEDWLDHVTPTEQEALQSKLQAVLDEWLTETDHQPPFYTVVDVKPYALQ